MLAHRKLTVPVCRATLGSLVFSRLRVADNTWSRLRGWYGYQPVGLDAILLTHTASIHTLGMGFALDVLWLDKHMQCIGWQLSVSPWRCCWMRGAAHVIERPAETTSPQVLQSVYQQALIIAPGTA